MSLIEEARKILKEGSDESRIARLLGADKVYLYLQTGEKNGSVIYHAVTFDPNEDEFLVNDFALRNSNHLEWASPIPEKTFATLQAAKNYVQAKSSSYFDRIDGAARTDTIIGPSGRFVSVRP